MVVDRVGFRTIETRGQSVLLNGEPIRFRGISTHEEPIGRDGAAHSHADMERLFGEAKALGANFVRAAHYPYSRHAARVADEMGLLLWAEVPIYWNIAWQNPDTLAVARDQLERLVTRDWSRASVVIWSVANETPYSPARMRFLEQLIDGLRSADDSRLISAALLGDTRRSSVRWPCIWLPMASTTRRRPPENEPSLPPCWRGQGRRHGDRFAF